MFGVNSESAHGQPRRARYRRGGFTSASGQVVRLPDLRQWAMTPPPHIQPRSNRRPYGIASTARSEEHTSELQSRQYLVCRLLLEKKKNNIYAMLTDRNV